MAGIVILILLIGILFYNNNLSKKREYELSVRNDQIQNQTKLIENSLKEKEILLKEVHHRVKNNLQIISSIINIQNDKTKDTKTKEILDELKLRISSIALTHQMLYQKGSMSEVLLNEYINNLVNQINISFDNQTVKIETAYVSPDIKLNIDLAIPLGLLVNEIITNAFKHAFKEKESGLIKVKVSIEGNNIKINVKDNGVGLPANYKDLLEEKQSLGFELIAILAEQINAHLSFKNNTGTEIEISFKA
jgi:two-component sensor histidine kinase